MSSTCFLVTLPTLLRFGSGEPLAIPAARSNSTEAGGVLRTKVKVRSVYTVTRTGKIMPSGSFEVFALNCLQKSMMFSPWGPSAVPTGGAGVALPAGNCSLMVVCIFFGGMSLCSFTLAPARAGPSSNLSAQLFHAGKVQFDRRRTPENRHRNLQAAVVVVDLLDRAVEVGKRPVHDAHLLV